MVRLLSIRLKFKTLLIFLFFLAIIDPILQEFGPFGLSLLDIFFTISLLAALYTISGNRRLLIAGILMLIPIFLLGWTDYAKDHFLLALALYALGIVFFGFVATSILIHILAEETVTMDLIYGSACVYFLIAITWAIGYGLIELIHPGSFKIAGHVMTRADHLGHYGFLNDNLSYYSFVTITTLGYGDIVPVSGPAKSISALEAVVGQLYIALSVARLVGLHTSQPSGGVPKTPKPDQVCAPLLGTEEPDEQTKDS
jgi:voltage-gated potassium channel